MSSKFLTPIVTPGLTVGGLGGIVKASTGVISTATAGTDYLAPSGSGSALTSLNASALASGTVPTARLGSGTASNGTALRGDQTYAKTPQLIYFENGTGSVSNTTTATTLTSGTGVGSLVLPSNFFSTIRALRISAGGFYSTASTGPNVTMYVRFGGIVIGQLGTLAAPGGVSTRSWYANLTLWNQAPGTSATFFGQGYGTLHTALGAGMPCEFSPSGYTVTGVDTTTTQTLNLVWQFGTANASNSATLINFVVEALN